MWLFQFAIKKSRQVNFTVQFRNAIVVTVIFASAKFCVRILKIT